MPDLAENSNNFPSRFSRASTQYTALGGTLTSYATDVPAFGDTGLSAQVVSTNYCTYSDDLTNAAWTKTNCSAVTDVKTHLGRSTTKLTDSGAGGGYVEFSHSNFFAMEFVHSVWLSCDSGTVSCTLYAEDATPDTYSENITVTTTPTRFYLAVNDFITTLNNPLKHRIVINDAGGVVYANLCQIETAVGRYPTDEIPTSGASGTRAVSSIEYGVAGIPTNDISGSFTFLCPQSENSGEFQPFLTVGLVDGFSSRISVKISPDYINLTKNGFVSAKGAIAALTPGTEYTCTWQQSSTTGMSITVNGETKTNASTLTLTSAPNKLYPAGETSPSSQSIAQVKSIKVEAV